MRLVPFLIALTLAAQDASEVEKHFERALDFSLQGQDELAIPEYRRVLELAPDLYEAHINLGQVLLRSQRPQEAVAHLERARQQKPGEFPPAYFLAEALFELGRYGSALQHYESAAAIDAQSGAAELGIGRTLARLGRRAEAAAHYRRAAQRDAQLHRFLLELGQLHEDNNELEAAAAIYREFPQLPGALERLGVLALRLGQTQEAIAAFEAAVRASPTSANRLALAQAQVRAGALAEAERILAGLAAEEPDNYELRMFYGRLLRDQRKIQDAARQFQQAARLRPGAAEAWSELAGMRILEGEYPAALAALDRVKELGAENTGHLFFRATTLDRMNRRKEALEYYQRFLEASTGHPDQEFQARQRVRLLERETGKR